jgi:hypothetical protein
VGGFPSNPHSSIKADRSPEPKSHRACKTPHHSRFHRAATESVNGSEPSIIIEINDPPMVPRPVGDRFSVGIFVEGDRDSEGLEVLSP